MSPYLDHLQQRIISARDALIKLESAQLELVKQRCISSLSELTVLAEMLGLIDVCSSQALLAHEYHYCRPEIVSEQTHWSIIAGRHPVVEHTLGHHANFIPNDLVFDSPDKTL
jgi:DNA mismatch repair protein MutS